jgi:hypothetical protein
MLIIIAYIHFQFYSTTLPLLTVFRLHSFGPSGKGPSYANFNKNIQGELRGLGVMQE